MSNATEMLYWGKELFSNTWLIGGKPAPFEQIGGNHGLLALANTPENKPLIDGLNDAATHQKGGIYKMSLADYEYKKKLKPLTQSDRKRPDMLQLRQSAVAPIFKPQINEESPVAPAAAAAGNQGFTPTEVPQPAKIITPAQPATVAATDASPTAEGKSNFKPTTARASKKIKPATESVP